MNNPFIVINDMQLWLYPMPGIDSNMYIVLQGDNALIVDPNKNTDALRLLKQNKVEQLLVLLTHEHFDHISGVNMFRQYFSCHVVCHEDAVDALSDPNKNMAKFWEIFLIDKPGEKKAEGLAVRDDNYSCKADETFSGRTEWQWKGHNLCAVAAPGHSKGGALYFFDELFFTGDNLVNGAGVICRIPGGSWKAYSEKTRPIIQTFPDNGMIFPGHGMPGTFGDLRKYIAKFGATVESIGNMSMGERGKKKT